MRVFASQLFKRVVNFTMAGVIAVSTFATAVTVLLPTTPVSAVAVPVCQTFYPTPFYSGATVQTQAPITITLQTQYQAQKDWHVSVASGYTITSINVFSNGGYTPTNMPDGQNQTGQTVLNGYNGSGIMWAKVCAQVVTPPAPVFTTCGAFSTLHTTSLPTWDFTNTRANGHYDLVPTGLHIKTDDASSLGKVAGYFSTNFSLKDLGTPTIDYTNTAGQLPGMNLALDKDGDGGFDGYLVIESGFAPNWWLAEGSVSAKATAPFDGAQPSYRQYWGTPQQWLNAFPDAKITKVGFSLGSGAQGEGVITKITAGCKYFTFQNANQAPSVPVLASPFDGVIRSSSDLNYSTWNASTDPDAGDTITYRYQSSFSNATNPDGSFQSIAFDGTTGSATQIQNGGPNGQEPEGTYYWHVKAIDNHGSESGWAAPWKIIIDNSAPSLPVHLLTANNGYETDNDFYFTWTPSSDVSTVTYEFQSSGSNAVDGNGSLVSAWNSIVNGNSEQNNLTTPDIHSTGAPDGTYYWQVRAIDALGHKSAWTAPWTMTIDHVAPVITVNSLFTLDSTPVLTGTVNDSTAAIEVTVNGNTYTGVNNGDGTWTADVLTALTDGIYDVTAKAIDPATNASYDNTTNELTVDAHVPGAPTLLFPLTNGFSNSTNTFFTWAGPFGVAHGPVKYNFQVATDLAFTNIVANTTGATNSFKFQSLADGVYYVRVSATDTLGGTGNWSTARKFTVDTVNPSVAISTPTNNDVVHGTVVLSGTATDLNPSSYRWAILDSSSNIEYIHTTVGDTVSPYSWDTTGVADGVYTIYLRATDDALNSVVTSVTVTVDNSAPAVAFTGSTPANLATVKGTIAVEGTFTDAHLAFARTGVIGHGWTCDPASPVSGDTQTCSIDTTTLIDGNYQIALMGEDSEGNISYALRTITVDNTAPVISFSASSYSFTGLPTIQGLVDDSTATLKLIVNGGTPIDVTDIIGTGWIHNFTSTIADGTYDLKLVAEDAAGNTSEATATLVVATPAPAAPSTAIVTPTTPAPQGVLGDSTETDTETTPEAAQTGVEGAKDVAAATDTDSSDGSIWGLAWYWWLLILAALAGFIWWLLAALRRRREEQN